MTVTALLTGYLRYKLACLLWRIAELGGYPLEDDTPEEDPWTS